MGHHDIENYENMADLLNKHWQNKERIKALEDRADALEAGMVQIVNAINAVTMMLNAAHKAPEPTETDDDGHEGVYL